MRIFVSPEKFIVLNAAFGFLITGICAVYATWFGPWPIKIAETLQLKELISTFPIIQESLAIYEGAFSVQAAHFFVDMYALNIGVMFLFLCLLCVNFSHLKIELVQRAEEEIIDKSKLANSHKQMAQSMAIFIVFYIWFFFFDIVEVERGSLSFLLSNRFLVYPIDAIRLPLFSAIGMIGATYSFTSISLYRSSRTISA